MSITNSDIVQKTEPIIHKTDVRVQLSFVVELEKTEMESIISNLQQQINSSKQMRTLIDVTDHQSRSYLIRKNNLTPESVTPSRELSSFLYLISFCELVQGDIR